MVASMVMGAGLSRGKVQAQAENLSRVLQQHNLVEPEHMYDPDTLHPYQQPPGGNTVFAENQKFLEVLGRYNQPTLGAIASAASQDSSALHQKSLLFGIGAVALIGGSVAAAFLAPHLGAAALGAIGAGGFASGVACYTNGRKAGEIDKFEGLLHGWATNLSDASSMFPIPADDGAVGFEYVQYCENMMISQRRNNIP